MAQRSRDARDSVADLGSIPECANPERKASARLSLRFFLEQYFPHSTGLSPLGQDQLDCIARMQVALTEEGWVGNIMPRGFIKSTMSENSVLWALLYGHQKYVLFFAGTAELAEKGIHSIRSELIQNELLLEDFPEACMPFIALQGKSQRCATQTFRGTLTGIQSSKDTLRLAMIPGFAGAGGICESYGLLAPPRGARFKDETGANIRPGFAVLDDPQTDESAKSYTQTQKRLSYIRNSISMMGGHGSAMAMCLNATIVAEGDLADRLSNGKTEESQAWMCSRVSMVKRMPDRLEDLWLVEYAKIRRTYDRTDARGQIKAKEKSTEYYRPRREIMDAGSQVSWENIGLERTEISALQHAMNILIDKGEETFYAECQNQPLRPSVAAPLQLDAAELAERTNGYAWSVIPSGRGQIVFHVDVHDELFYYSVCAVGQDFSGDVLAYGCWPEQPNSWFNLRTAKVPLSRYYADVDSDQAIQKGLIDVLSKILETHWTTAEGKRLPVSCGLVDAGYKPKIVANAIRHMSCGDRVMSAKGIGIGPRKKPMPEYDLSPQRCLRAGPDPQQPRWFYPSEFVDGGILRVHFDTNFWKSVAASRLSQGASDGAWRLWGSSSVDHTHYCSHLTAERPTQETAEGRTVNTWHVLNNQDNHWWDTLVGCAVAASIMGCTLPSEEPIRYSEEPVVAAAKQEDAPKFLRPDGRDYFITSRDDY